MHGASFVFSAEVLRGAGRGKRLGTPTLNLALSQVPTGMDDGVYACTARIDGLLLPAVLHYGPRPSFGDTRSCEVHLLDSVLPQPPPRITVTIVGRLRDIKAFASPAALQGQIARDIEQARALLHGQQQDETGQ